MMRIGELAARTGVSTRALRYYEEQGLLAAERSESGQRHYVEDMVDRVVLIQRLYGAGLNSQAIAQLLPCVHTGIATPDMLERLAHERARVERQIAELAETRDRLSEVIQTAMNHAQAPVLTH